MYFIFSSFQRTDMNLFPFYWILFATRKKTQNKNETNEFAKEAKSTPINKTSKWNELVGRISLSSEREKQSDKGISSI